MQLSIRNAAGRFEPVEKQIVAGRTVLRLKHGDRLEIIDPATGAAPAGVKAHRGGANGNDLIIEGFGESVLIEGFFEQTAEGEQAVAVDFPGGGAPEITPATPELAMPGAVLDTGFAMAGDSTGYMTMAQAAGGAVATGAGASTAAAGASGAAGAVASASNLWWIAGGVAGAGAAGAAIEHNSSDNDDKGSKTETPPPPAAASFDLVRSSEAVDEGETVTFTLNTTNVAPGTQYTYTISGISASDVQGGLLTGIVTIDANGRAVIQVTLTEDLKTEGVENLTITVAGQDASVAINDVSTTLEPPVPTFDLSASSASVDEGNGVSFTLNTTNVAPGTQYSYVITGISPTDIVGGAAALSGVVTIDANGRATLEIHLAADATTEGLETLTIEIAGQTVVVDINDLSLTPAFALTTAQDNVTGTSWDDTINGSNSTYTTGDVIDGGAGHDRLNLTLPGGTLADGVKVSNVEQVNVQAPVGSGGVELSMTGFDSSVTQINIESARADVTISDQQSLAAVSITDVSETAITLNYDSQVVTGDADKLKLTIDEFVGALNVDAGIEALDVQVNDGIDEASALALTAEGATDVMVSGGVAGQSVAFDLAMNGERAAGATFDATQFAGNVVMTNVAGGDRQFAYSVEFTQGLQQGETATLMIDGHEYTVTADSAALSPSELVDQFMMLIHADFPQHTHNALGSESAHALIVYGLFDPVSVEAQVADAAMNVVDTFDYADFGGTSSGVVAPVVNSEISNLQLGAGDDVVVVFDSTMQGNDISYGDNYNLGDGDNTLVVTVGSVHGTVSFGTGDGTMVVGEDIGAAAQVSFGAGDSELTLAGAIKADASVSFLSGNNTVSAANVLDDASVVFGGDGDNTLTLETQLMGFSPVNEYGRIAGNASVSFNGSGNNRLIAGEILDNASVSFGAGANVAEAGDIEGEATVTFGDGDNTLVVRGEDGDISGNATVTFGNGDNQLQVGGDIRGEDASVTFGDGANTVDVVGSIKHASLEFGDGNNDLSVGGEMQSATVSFGAGANTVDVDTNLHFSTLTFGDGGNTVTVGEELRATNIELGSGNDEMSVDKAIRDGSQVNFGAGNDVLNLGGGGAGRVHVHGGDDATVIDMGDGNDTMTIVGSNDCETDTVVRSGGFLQGGAGNDTLTVKAVDDIEALVARTQAQQVELTFDGNYAVDQQVSVTIDGVKYSYIVQASDIVQGDASGTRANVAAGVLTVIQQDLAAALTASVGDSEDTLVLEGEVGIADVAVVAEGITSEVTRTADAGIAGFETLNLIAVNPDTGEDGTDNDHATGAIAVDFSLVSGVQQINLSSEVTLHSEVQTDDGIVNGVYTTNHSGDSAEFTLVNLPAGLGEHISVAGNEVTATGNRQVERISIGNASGDHEIGDVITLCIDDVKYSITVDADDLSGATAQEDADKIAARLAEIVQAGNTGFTVARDGNVLTLIGSSDVDVEVDFDSDGNNDCHDQLQCATPADDQDIDVSINAVLDQDVDTDNDTLALTVNGTGDFDLGIDGAWDGFSVLDQQAAVAYENLSIDVQDDFSHYINTDENGDNDEFVGGMVTLTGGAEGATIVIDEVMAKTVTSTSAANVEVIFDERADQGEDEDFAFTVTTLGGDDVVDMEDVIFSSQSTIDLGAGVDRLIIGNGHVLADVATGSSSALDQGLMFRNVSNVEELEFDGEDSITFEDDAFEAGFEKLIVGDDSTIVFTLANGFERDLSIELEDDVLANMTVVNFTHALNITAQDDVTSTVILGEDSASDLTLTAGDCNVAAITQMGEGSVTATFDDHAVAAITSFGGDITATTDRKGSLGIVQLGLGGVAVTAGAKSVVGITFGEDSEASTANVSVVQTTSHENTIGLANLAAGQNVTVDITLAGGEDDDAVVADLELEAAEYETDLSVTGEDSAGIDKLTLRSDAERGASSTLGVAVADSWAVGDGEDATIDMTIDASSVQAEYVLINASQEDDANLNLIGSATAGNVILGGGLGDTIKGGAGMDFLQGDRIDGLPQVSSVSFATAYDAGDIITLTIDGQTIEAVIGDEYSEPVSGDVIAAAFASYINSGLDDSSDHITFTGGALAGGIVKAGSTGWALNLTGVVRGEDFAVSADVDNSADLGPSPHVIEFTPVGWDAGESLQLVFNGGNVVSLPYSIDLATSLANFVMYQSAGIGTLTGGTLTVNDTQDGLILTGLSDGTPLSYVALEARVVDADTGMVPMGTVTIDITEARGEPGDQTIDVATSQQASNGSIEGIASDTLEGGAGSDIYLFAESQLDTMDTIVGLDLGGATLDEMVDGVALGVYMPAGDFNTMIGAPGSTFQTQNALEVETVVNNGQAANLSGVSLEAAVATLFQADGWFEEGGSADTNAAGLFNWGDDTYLIAVGDIADGSFGADDYIVKVTGVTGTLDITDFYQQMVG